MGDYTRMRFDAVLHSSTPPTVTHVLIAAMDGRPLLAEELPDHPWFKTERWQSMFRGYSAYFKEAPGIRHVTTLPDGRTHIAFHSSFKNYDGEIEAFCSWIAPFIDAAPGAVIGEVETEDDKYERDPTLLISQSGRIDVLISNNDRDEESAFGGYRGPFKSRVN